MVDHAPAQPEAAPGQARIALAHDWLCGMRGGEAVLERLVRLCGQLGQTDRLYTMFDDGRPLAPGIDATPRTVSPLGRLPAGLRRWLLPLYPWAVGRLSAALSRRQREAPVDLLVSTSSAAIKGLRPPPGVPHVCYCHAPARYVWSVAEEYASGRGPAALARRLGLRLARGPFRSWDRRSAARVSHFVANSAHTAGEIKRCFGREARVVHPPVRTDFFTPDPATLREDFWLFVAALEPYKRADLAIEAARLAGAKLLVVGDGSDAPRLRAGLSRGRAHDPPPHTTVQFFGRVSDERLRDLYRRARVLIFPQVEDFGITAVEAQACGCPVVARRRGGALDTVVEGQTGAFFDEPDPRSIVRAVEACPDNPDACRENAGRFSTEAFDRAMHALLAEVLISR